MRETSLVGPIAAVGDWADNWHRSRLQDGFAVIARDFASTVPSKLRNPATLAGLRFVVPLLRADPG